MLKSMEVALKTSQELAKDKDEVIQSQREIIERLKDDYGTSPSQADLKRANIIITKKDAELQKCKEEITRLKGTDEATKTEQLNQLTREIESERQANRSLMKKLDDQEYINEKTEFAFNTQENLINAKDEIIKNLKTIISQGKDKSCNCVQKVM